MAIMASAEAAAGALIGWLVDRWAGTAPRWMTIGGAVGIVLGLTSLVTAAFKLTRSQATPSHTHHGKHHDPDD